MTPMMAQYHAIKEKAGDALLFYRMGDFYELFFDDAISAATTLDITLTRRGKKDGEDIPMCGVPFHAVDTYVARLIRRGFTVAICEQTETPEVAKKRGNKSVVARDIVRIVTPGTLTEDAMLEAARANYLCAIALQGDDAAVATIDVSTSDVDVYGASAANVPSLLASLQPAETLFADREGDDAERILNMPGTGRATPLHPSKFSLDQADRVMRALYDVSTTDGLAEMTPLQRQALGAALGYLELTQIDATPFLKSPKVHVGHGGMAIDATTRRSLELHQSSTGGRSGSLLDVIDRTRSAGGSRLLSTWLGQPLAELSDIISRQQAIKWFVDKQDTRQEVAGLLAQSPDMARALSRLSIGRGGPRDLKGVGVALGIAASTSKLLTTNDAQERVSDEFSRRIGDLPTDKSDQFQDLIEELDRALDDPLPLLARDGGFIAPGYSAELDELRDLRTNARGVILELEERYRTETGIKALKIKHSRVMGYTLEAPATHTDKMSSPPLSEQFRHRQTLANAVRYTTPEIAELDSKISRAADQALALEGELFEQLRAKVCGAFDALSAVADALAWLDVTSGLATLAVDDGYVLPTMVDGAAFDIAGGRHPVVEHMLRTHGKGIQSFVPNDCQLGDANEALLALITGPNMAGKSTFLRQNALITVLAHIGSYVPAERATIGIVDRLFSRVGAADDIARGQSTFMVEMVETASILNQATSKSLVILDEVGRGTSTFDGMSIAWATLEYLHDTVRCRGLFATHYHELTTLSEQLRRLHNRSMAAKEWNGDVVFLHSVQSGPADRSYGLAVAKLAGVPRIVVRRAQNILNRLEADRADQPGQNDLPLFDAPVSQPAGGDNEALTKLLEELNPDDLTPRDALDVLYQIKGAFDAE